VGLSHDRKLPGVLKAETLNRCAGLFVRS